MKLSLTLIKTTNRSIYIYIEIERRVVQCISYKHLPICYTRLMEIIHISSDLLCIAYDTLETHYLAVGIDVCLNYLSYSACALLFINICFFILLPFPPIISISVFTINIICIIQNNEVFLSYITPTSPCNIL